MVEWDDRLKDVKHATIADPYNDSSDIVHLVGGYILTLEQVFAFADRNKFEIPSIDATTYCANEWLESQGVPYRLLPATYKGQPRIVLVTRVTYRNDETKYKFTPFPERPEDRVVKAKMVEWDDRLKDANMQQLRILMVLRGLAGYYISGVDALTQTISQVNFEADLYHAYLHFIPTSYNRDSSNVIHMHTCTRVWVRLCLISFVSGDLTCLSIVA